MLNQNEKHMKKQNTFTLIKWNNNDQYEIIINYNDSYDCDKSKYIIIDHYESLDEAISDRDFYSQSEDEDALHAQFIKYVL
tara:strand:- start:943 stop:1185 length:243 start_codon:yes stop_codon:yes gene_type:complete